MNHASSRSALLLSSRSLQRRSISSGGRRCPMITTSLTSLLSARYHHHNRRLYSRIIHRFKSSSSSTAFLDDLPLADSVRESVKSSLLHEAVRDDSRLWNNNKNKNSNNNAHNHHNFKKMNGSINESTLQDHLLQDEDDEDDDLAVLEDPLDDLYLSATTSLQYWPHLPPSVSQANANDVDPFALTKNELDLLQNSIRHDLIGTDHPVLHQAASYFFSSSGGKKIRPLMVLLLSRALADSVGVVDNNDNNTSNNNSNTTTTTTTTSTDDHHLFSTPLSWQRPDLPQAQRRLAEISEMIHTASLFHDDVLDQAETRRSLPAAHHVFGPKVAILAGDYLLARASICLARLRHAAVVECMSTVIEHLVRGEVMQMHNNKQKKQNDDDDDLQYYLRKTFYKTASLMAHSCQSAALLGDYPNDLVLGSYRFGKHVGMAFQLVDDVLDFEGSLRQLGKPSLSDLKSGLATAPVLFAAQEFPDELEPLMERKFQETGDVERAVELVAMSSGMQQTKELARLHAEAAMDVILEWNNNSNSKPSVHRDALVHLANKVVARTK